MSLVRLHRVYGDLSSVSGRRVLVDRVWPGRLRKESLALDAWLRELGPSDELRRWFGRRHERWEEFQRRCRAGLERPAQRQLLDRLAALAREGSLTLRQGTRSGTRR